MRTLPLVVSIVALNDVALVFLLDLAAPTWTLLLGGSVALTATVFGVLAVTVDDNAPPSRRELAEDLATLRERVDALEE